MLMLTAAVRTFAGNGNGPVRRKRTFVGALPNKFSASKRIGFEDNVQV